MTTISLDDIKKQVDKLAAKIKAPKEMLPTYGKTEDFARPHIEIDNTGTLHYVVVERGEELERKSTSDADELLYWVFSSITFNMAINYEVQHRAMFKDPRRKMFSKQIELLQKMSEAWAQKEAEDHQKILKEHPFKDKLF